MTEIKEITPGHRYQVPLFENPNNHVTIQFIQKATKEEGSTELVTEFDGVTNEALLEVLIKRSNFLYNKFPSRETAIAITKMEEALMWFEKRTADRKKRGVEGKQLK